jgi:exodeoxyribonuclease V alpha subunit
MHREWANRPKFGEQFKIVFYKSMVPASVHGIQKYPGSGLIKGIGPAMAKRTVKRFGKKPLRNSTQRDGSGHVLCCEQPFPFQVQ